jgi:hypothetical protein
VAFKETCVLSDIGIGIEVSKTPSLMLQGVLNIKLESNQDPLKLKGTVKAGITSASAMMYAFPAIDLPRDSVLTVVCSASASPWVNPFNVSKQVTIEDFRIQFEITYATIMEAGPS